MPPAFSLPPHPQRIRHPIDVIEPRRDQRNLQNPAIVKPRRPQPLNVVLPTLGSVLGQLDHIVHHHPLLRRDRRGRVVLFQSLHQFFIQRHSTQKLCVRLDSIHSPVGHRDHGRDHFMLPPAQRQLRRHQRAKRSERVIERLRNQRVRPHNRRPSRLIRMHRRGILYGIQRPLPLHRTAQLLIHFQQRYGFNPSHSRNSPPSCARPAFKAQPEDYTLPPPPPHSAFVLEAVTTCSGADSQGNPFVHSLLVTLGNHAIPPVQPYNCTCSNRPSLKRILAGWNKCN